MGAANQLQINAPHTRHCFSLCNKQSGFSPARSTVAATTAAVDDTVNSLDQKRRCAELFVGLPEASDTVDQNICTNKLLPVGFGVSAHTRFKSQLSDCCRGFPIRSPHDR